MPMTSIRQPAVAGTFYPGDARELDSTVRDFLSGAGGNGPVPKALIAPHAGYVYSGAVAAEAYARLAPAAERITRVVLIGPCHRVAVRGLAVSGAEGFATPLGTVPVDDAARTRALELPQVRVLDDAHAEEHSLEVHLPFLQVMLGDFSIVPLVVGQASTDQVAGVLEALWGGPETLIVVSSDLSHYLDYEAARTMDGETCRAIERLDAAGIGPEQACGRVPVAGLLALARRRGLRVATVDLRNSGDTAGTRDRVVGYGAWVFTEGAEQEADAEESDFDATTRALLARHGTALLHMAATSIEYGVRHARRLAVDANDHPPDLGRDGACFVTLKRHGKLRGCIGSPRAHRPLVVDVAGNAYSAAFGDKRFKKLTAAEIDGLVVSLSLLSESFPMTFADEADLVGQLRPGIDGLVIEDGNRRSLFLPAVWKSLPDAAEFLGQLKEKAGLGADHWSADLKAWRFVAEDISSRDLEDPASIWAGRDGVTGRLH